VAGSKITLTNNEWTLLSSLQYRIKENVVEDIYLYLPRASIILNLIMFSMITVEAQLVINFGLKILVVVPLILTN
jgi:hypothetical protein